MSRHSRIGAWIGAIVFAGAALSACGGPASPSAAAAGKVVVALQPQTEPDWWFPIESATAYTNLNGQISDLMYLPLINVTPQDVVTPQGAVAQRVTWNATGTVYHVFLRHGLRWSNGRPVTARDVVFAWDIIKGSTAKNAPWTYGGTGSGGIPADWKSVIATNPGEVTVTLAQSANPLWFVHNALSQIWPVPMSVWDKYPHNMTQELKYIEQVANSPLAAPYKVVDGPWTLTAARNSQYWAFKPNTHYSGHHASIASLVYQYEGSGASIFAALKRNTVNVAYLPFSLYGSRTQLKPDVVSHVWVLGFTGIALNETSAAPNVGNLFTNLYIRQALEMGINQTAIAQRMYDGFAVPDYGPVPSEPGTVFYYRNLPQPYSFNPAAGRALLERHGWTMHNGVMTRNGTSLSFQLIYPAGSQTDARIVQLIQGYWAQEGVRVTLRLMQKNSIYGLSPGQSTWAASWAGNGWTYEPDYYPTGGELFACNAASNGTGYCNKTMDHLITNTYLPGTSAQVASRMQAYQQYAITQLPELWMPHYALLTVHAPSVHGVNRWFNSVTYYNQPNHWTISG